MTQIPLYKAKLLTSVNASLKNNALQMFYKMLHKCADFLTMFTYVNPSRDSLCYATWLLISVLKSA